MRVEDLTKFEGNGENSKTTGMGLSNPSCFIDYIIKNKKIWKIQLLFRLI